MSIEWLRDLVICIFGLSATVVVIFTGVLCFLLYRRLKSILDSAKATARTVEDISYCVGEEIVKPLVGLAVFAQGIRQVVDLVSRFSKKRRKEKNG